MSPGLFNERFFNERSRWHFRLTSDGAAEY